MCAPSRCGFRIFSSVLLLLMWARLSLAIAATAPDQLERAMPETATAGMTTGMTARMTVPNRLAVAERSSWDIFSARGAWDIEHPEWLTAHGEGTSLTLDFDFPAAPAQNWNQYRAWAGHRFQPAADLSHYDGITFVATPVTPAINWTVDVLLVEDDGSVYLDRAAVTLDRSGPVRGYALFRDFTIGPWVKQNSGLISELSKGQIYQNLGDFTADIENDHLDLDRIAAIYFGTIHAHGGKNSVTLQYLELIRLPSVAKTASPGSNGSVAPPPGTSPAPVTAGTPPAPMAGAASIEMVTMDPSVELAINGTTGIPPGDFGLHIPGYKDVVAPETLAAGKELRPGYLRTLHSEGGGTLEEAQTAKFTPNSFEESVVKGLGVQEWVLGIRGGDRPPTDVDSWAYGAVADLAHTTRGAPRGFPPPRFEVWNEPNHAYAMTKGQQTGDIQAMLDDPFRMGYILGPVAERIYRSVYDAAVTETRSLLPGTLVGGFSLDLPSGEDWGMWNTWWRPLLDGPAGRYDFLTEHHYGETGTSYQANLSLLAAVNIARQGRITPIYNTEAGAAYNDTVDNRHFDTPDFTWWTADYEIQDILTMLREPDEVVARASHMFPAMFARHGDVADEAQRRPVYWAHYVLRDLRGDRRVIQSAPPGPIETVASADGANLIVALYNHSDYPQQAHLHIPAPGRSHFTQLTERHFGYDHTAHALLLEKGKVAPLQGATYDLDLNLPGRFLECYTLQTDRLPTPERELDLDDAYADRWMFTLYPGYRESVRMFLPDLSGVASASLRLAVQGVDYGAGSAIMNGHPLAIPFATANHPTLEELPIDLAWLKPGENTLTLVNNNVPGAGQFRFVTAAIRTVRESLVRR